MEDFSLFITVTNILLILFKTEASGVRFNKYLVMLSSISQQYILIWKVKLIMF